MKSTKILLFLFCTFYLFACSPYLGREQPNSPQSLYAINTEQSVGQTFVSQYAGLEGIEFRFHPEDHPEGIIHVHIRSGSNMDHEVVSARISTDSFPKTGLYNFRFEPQRESSQTYYYIFFKFEGEGNFWVGSAAGHTYPDGSMHVNHEPIDQQMMFHLLYNPRFLIWGLCKELLSWIGILICAICIFILPGLALLVFLYPNSHTLPKPSLLALSAGLSIAIYPLLFLWTDILNLHLGSLYGWLPVIAGTVYLLWRIRSWQPKEKLSIIRKRWLHSKAVFPDILLFITLGAILLVRFFLIRTLEIPMWGDSVHHTMITQLLVNNKGLFNTWEPLSELQSLTYHFGFHANSAVFHWITGLSIPESVLWTAQIFNIFAVFTLYPLARKIGEGKWGGIAVLLIAGLLSPMPNYYVNWGRFTQLAGQVILPCVAYFVWEAIEKKPLNWRLITLSWITMVGLGLTHYRIIIFAVIFLLAFFFLNIRKRELKHLLLITVLIGVGAGVIFLPWFIHTFEGRITTTFLNNLSRPANSASDYSRQYNAIGDIRFFLPTIVWSIFIIASIWGVVKKIRGVLVILMWWFLNLLATNPQWLLLPGEGSISNFAYFIAIYIPTSIIIGVVFFKTIKHLLPHWNMLIFILLLLLLIWGVSIRLKDLNYKERTLVTIPDLHAAQWIKENINENALFLTHSIFAYNDSVNVGFDAGWWLPLLAERNTTLPPITYNSEKGPRPDYQDWINHLYSELYSKGIHHPDVMEMMLDRKVSHIYIGQLHHRANSTELNPIHHDILLNSGLFNPIYHKDRIWIFEIAHNGPTY